MDQPLKNLLDRDDEVFNCFAQNAEELIAELKQSEYSNSILCLMGLMGTINSLKLAAFDLVEESDTHLYAIKTLLRPAIEHFLRFSYLHVQLIENKNDYSGEEYRKYSVISETIAMVKSRFALEPDKTIQTKVLKQLKSSHKLEISNSQLDKIVLKWSYKNIARKLDNVLNKDKQQRSFIRTLVSKYSELSSFVHGGIYAEQYYHSSFSDGTLSSETRADIELLSFLAATARSHMLMVGCFLNPKFETIYSDYSKKMAMLLATMDEA